MTLTQEVTVTPGRPFRLEFVGTVETAGDPPVAAIHWNGANGPIEPTVELELTPDGVGLRAAAGQVPDGVTTAEVSLTLAGVTTVKPDHFLLRTGVTTGLTFLVFAEAPGELDRLSIPDRLRCETTNAACGSTDRSVSSDEARKRS